MDKKLSQTLLNLGFFSALGTSEEGTLVGARATERQRLQQWGLGSLRRRGSAMDHGRLQVE